MLLKKEFPAADSPITERSCVAVKRVSGSSEVYIAISDDKGAFTVWQMSLDAKEETVKTGPTPVLTVESAHNDLIVELMQFVEIRGESYLTTGAGLDQRVNLWRI